MLQPVAAQSPFTVAVRRVFCALVAAVLALADSGRSVQQAAVRGRQIRGTLDTGAKPVCLKGLSRPELPGELYTVSRTSIEEG